MSRRVSLLLAISLLLMLLTGCGKNVSAPVAQGSTFGSDPSAQEDSAQSAQEEVIPSNGSFAMPYNASYGWDPYACMGMENRAVMQLIYEGLFTLNNSFDAEPWLCESFTVSEDGLNYVLSLRDAKFSSGQALSPEDVVYSMTQAEASDLYSSRFRDIAAYYVSGLSSVTIELFNANDRLPCLLTFPIVPNLSSTASGPVGTGPFVRSSDGALTQNAQWWGGAQNLGFQTVTLYSSVSAEDTRDNFEIDRVHFVYNNPSATTAATFHCDYELWNSRGTVMQYLSFNFNEGIFQDREVRAAVSRAIDRNSIAESVYHNFADAAALPVAPSSSMYYEDLALKYTFTTAQAARDELVGTPSFYLPEDQYSVSASPSPSPSPTPTPEEEPEDEDAEESGEDSPEPSEEPEGTAFNRITLLVRAGNLSREAAAKEVAQDLTDAGFSVTMKVLENDEFFYTIYNEPEQWDLFYGEVTLKPDFDLRSILYSGGDLDYARIYPDDELRELTANAMENSGNRYDLYEYVMDHGYLCPVMFINNAVFTTRGVFSGLNPAPDNLFYEIANIRVNHN